MYLYRKFLILLLLMMSIVQGKNIEEGYFIDQYGNLTNTNNLINRSLENQLNDFDTFSNRDIEDPIIINQFNLPTGVGSLEYINGNLWLLSSVPPGMLTILDPNNGDIIIQYDLIELGLSIGISLGFTKYENNLIIADRDTGRFVKIDIETFEIVEYIPTIPGHTPIGITWDGSYFWYQNFDQQITTTTTCKMNSNFEIIEQFSLPDGYPFGNVGADLTWDGEYLWYSETEQDFVHRINPEDFSIDRSIRLPWFYPNGVAYGNQFLWVAVNGDDILYQLDIGYNNNIEGDIDNNGGVNILDIIILINLILDDEYNLLGDLNDDGILNISDCILLMGLILGNEL